MEYVIMYVLKKLNNFRYISSININYNKKMNNQYNIK